MASSAFEELSQTGELGPVTLELLRRLVHQVRRTYGFPPPEEYSEWTDDAAYNVITAMLTREGEGRKFVTSCFVLAADDASLERLFLATIKNFLIDEAKKTPRGKLRRRIARLMSEDPAAYRKVPGTPPRWALAEHAEGAVWQGDLDDLIAQAARVTGVGITRWNHSGPTPKQTVHALKTVLLNVLQYAQGAVREEDLAKVLQARFELLAPARFTTLYADEGTVSELVGQHAATTADPVGVEGVAEDIWQHLSPNERLLLPHLEEDAHHAAQLLEIRHHHAAAVLSNLKTKLHTALSAESDQRAVMAALLRRGDDAQS